MPVIEVSHLTKEYRLGALQGLKQTVMNAGARLMGRPVPERPLFKALDDVSFRIEQGEVVGIIGHNGAGKSTLLKMLARISTPTRGSVKVNGRIAPLIEVGAGFVPDFTGRENVYLNGAILGMSKAEIDRKFDEIVDFAEMAEFIDTPVKRYSSGMQVKLAFSVATSVEAEILIVDEVLAVGDLAFQRKCFDRLESLISRGDRTVLIVSHNIRQIERLCSRAIMLDHGKVFIEGDKTSVCEAFYRKNNEKVAADTAKRSLNSGRSRNSGEVDLLRIDFINKDGQQTQIAVMNQPITIRCYLNVKRHLVQPEVIVGLHTTDFFYVASMSNTQLEHRPNLELGQAVVDCSILTLPLLPGVFAIRLGILDITGREVFYGEMLKTLTVVSLDTPQSKLPQVGVIELPCNWHQLAVDSASSEEVESLSEAGILEQSR